MQHASSLSFGTDHRDLHGPCMPSSTHITFQTQLQILVWQDFLKHGLMARAQAGIQRGHAFYEKLM